MPVDFDGPPIYDPITKYSKDLLSDIWIAWMSNFQQTIISYLSQFGFFLPQLTALQRDSIQSPSEGQMIYNIDIKAPQIWQNGSWKTFTTF